MRRLTVEMAATRIKLEPQVLGEAGSSAAEDGRLVAQVLRKDRKATAEFVERYADCVHAYVRHRLMPRAEAVDDLAQEVFLAAWRGLGSFRGESSLQSWLLGIARHKVEDYYRKRLRELEIPDETEDSAPEYTFIPTYEEELDRKLAEEKMRAVLSKLPEIYSLVLHWRYMERRNAREMAQLADRTEKAIERLLARAREQFRKEWNNERKLG